MSIKLLITLKLLRNNSGIFATRKSQVNCQLSIVKGSPKGFTLVETLIAIAILMISIVGPISLIGDSLHKIYYAKDQMIATNLAHEGIEAVRFRRDENMLNNITFNNAITDGDYIYRSNIPLSNPGLDPFAITSDKKIYSDNATGIYTQGSAVGATPTQFSRIINISTIQPLKEIKVISTVTWVTGGGLGTISVTEHLFKTF